MLHACCGILNNETKVELPGFCKILPKQWFNQRESRFDEACLEHKLESGTPSTVPHPFMKCSNPLEVIAAIAICVSMVSISERKEPPLKTIIYRYCKS